MAVNVYDEVLYPSRSYPIAHPDRMATLAILFGMQPTPIDRCRVLELGCGSGGNLLPMAYMLPESVFVGIDLAPRPIAEGQARAEALGLQNLTLRRLDVMDVSPAFGSFDYIIAHGVYSWVPAPMRDKVLAICKANLAPQGVAYVSYNVYPLGYQRQMVREMMLFHAQRFEGSRKQIGQARAMLKLLLEAQPAGSPYQVMLQQEMDRIKAAPDEYLFHDDLAEVSATCYFHEFMEEAGRHGLQFLSEAHFFEMQDHHLPAHVSEALGKLGDDLILREQYLDFLKGRRFRQTLLCHRDVHLDRDIKPERLRGFYVASPARPVPAEPGANAAAMEAFEGIGGIANTNAPLEAAVLRCLGEAWPRAVRFDELLAAARSRTGRDAGEGYPVEHDTRILEEMVLKLYAVNFLALHVYSPHFVRDVSERPVASPLARLQVQSSPFVNTLSSDEDMVGCDKVTAFVLLMLDGTRDRAMLLDELVAAAEAGALRVEHEGDPVTDAAQRRDVLAGMLDHALTTLARLALLIA